MSETITPLQIASPAPAALPKTEKTIYVSPAGNDTNDGSTPEKAWRTPKSLASGMKLLLAPGTYNTKGLMLGGLTDVAIGAYSLAANGPLPVLFAGDGDNIFSFSATTARVSISQVKCDSNYDQAITAGKYAYRAPKGNFGNVRGVDITIDAVQLADLAEGIDLDGVTRCLINAVAQVEPLGMPSRCLMINDGTDLTVTGCSFVNAINESPLRATDLGIVRGLFKGNTISQLLDANHGRATAKAAVTIRQATGLQWINNTVVNGELSFTSDHLGKQLVSEVQISGGSVSGSLLQFCDGASDIEVNGLVIINHTGSECVSDSAGMAKIVYAACQFSGDSCAIKFYADSDATVIGNSWNPSKPGLPMLKASGGVSMAKVIQ